MRTLNICNAWELCNVRFRIAWCCGSLTLLFGCGQGGPRPLTERGNASAARAQATALLPDHGVSATFSIVAVDPDAGVCGAAVASKYPAVGRVVPIARAGVGAFCTQHWHNPEWRERAIELLADGKGPGEVLIELTRDDPRSAQRQLAIIDAQGRTAVHQPTGADVPSRWWGAATGRFYACQGNTLTGPEVVTAMAKAYERTTGTLADRLMAALVAGDCAGGDHRGRLAAGIVVAKPKVAGNWLELYVDNSDDAVIELAKAYAALEHEAKGGKPTDQPTWKHPCADRPEVKPPAE